MTLGWWIAFWAAWLGVPAFILVMTIWEAKRKARWAKEDVELNRRWAVQEEEFRKLMGDK